MKRGRNKTKRGKNGFSHSHLIFCLCIFLFLKIFRKEFSVQKGKIYSYKCCSMVSYGSSIMKDYIVLADFDSTVETFIPEPFGIPYLDLDGKERIYTPDYLTKLKPKKRLLIECKPDEQVNDLEVVLKRKAGIAWCESQKDTTYLMVTPKILRKGFLLKNVYFLRRYAKMKPPLPFQSAAVEELKSAGRIRLDQLSAIVGHREPTDHMYIYNLLYWGILVTDIKDYEISLKSWVYLQEAIQ